MSLLDYATRYQETYGFEVLPMGGDKCNPMVKWKQQQTRRANLGEFDWHRASGMAVITGELSNVCVLDFESVDMARKFWQAESLPTQMIVRSPRGIHLYYQHPGQRVKNGQRIQYKGTEYDVRGDGGYALLPPSVAKRGAYKWIKGPLPGDWLPRFQMRWRPETESTVFDEREIHNAEKYIAKIFAISGEGGHDATWRAVNRIKDSGVDETTCMAILSAWNQTNANPPWEPRELLHKVKGAYR